MFDGITAQSVGLLVGVIYSICIHEAAHAFTADRLGDPTARMLGRCTLNPIPHIQATPIPTLVFPLITWLFSGGTMVFGGGACPVNVRNLKNPRRDDIIVSAAGPASNFLLCFLATALICIPGFVPEKTVAFQLVVQFAVMNLILCLFNLLPAPPLDGSRILMALSPDTRRFYENVLQYGEYIPLLVAMVVFRYVGQPVISVYFEVVSVIYNIFR